MKITLRKKDSVTSIVLFLFNIFEEFKKEHSIKLNHLLGLIQYFNKSEVSVRTTLSRMVKSEILLNSRENNETIYLLTNKGMENIRLWNKALNRYFMRMELRQREWDKQWNLLSVINFNKSEYENLIIIEELAECGLREINNNTWITPHKIDEDIIHLLKSQNLSYLNFSGTFNSNLDIDSVINETFGINELRKKYFKFLTKIENNKDGLNVADPASLLPILFEIGWDFYDIATIDPVLPRELLNVWQGDQAANEMKIFRPKILSQISILFNNFYN